MAEKNAQEIIQSIITAEIYSEGREKGSKIKAAPKTTVVTISRFFGANGTRIAHLLATRLQVGLYDQELLNAVVQEAKGDKYLLEKMDEKVTSVMDDLVHAFFSKKSSSKEDFYRYMIKVILGITHTGGVIVGRGAHLLMPAGRAFRVRIDGSMDACVMRVSKNLGIKKKKAEKLIVKTNEERAKFVKRVFERFPATRSYYDLTINSDMFTPEQVVEIIVTAMAQAGYPVPDN